MTTLLDLEPREAGTTTREPVTTFDAGLDELHKRVQCAPSTACGANSADCIATQ